MSDYKILQTESAVQDLARIYKDVFDFTLSEKTASKTITTILDEIDNLRKHAKLVVSLSALYPDYDFAEDYKRVLSGKYVIIYFIDKKNVVITRIFFGGQNFQKLLTKN